METLRPKENRALLKRYFGYDALKKEQEAAVEAILHRQDVLAILPTGYGKSLCYQLPALQSSGLTVVISPLISLMKDQVDGLTERGIHATYLNSSVDSMELLIRRERLREGRYRLLYISPESLDNPVIRGLLKDVALAHVAVDEAHCISLWGHDFRPAYLKIRAFLDELPKRPVVSAFTATATTAVITDMKKLLGLHAPHFILGNPDRPNLHFRVESPKEPLKRLQEFILERRGESGIVYCQRRKEAEEVARILKEQGFSAGLYHGGVEDALRRNTQEDFAYDRISIVVATSAFGMGIDKSNVRYVVHFGLPLDLSAYYQEAGRAGRDGLLSECILLHRPDDYRRQQGMILSSDHVLDRKKVHIEKLQHMRGYATETGCLRRYLLRYFHDGKQGEEVLPEKCGQCGNCLEEGWVNASQLGQQMLQLLLELPGKVSRRRYGSLLLGEQDPTVSKSQEKGTSLPSFGCMKRHSLYYVNHMLDLLLREGFLRQGNHVLLTEKGRALLRGETPFLLRREEATVREALEEALYQKLQEVRRILSGKENKAPYIIFHDATLREMVKMRPMTLESFQEVHGVGQSKGLKYGPPFLKAIHAFVKEKNLQPIEEKRKRPGVLALSGSGESTYALFAKGLSLPDIAKALGIQPTTVVDHLIRAHGSGEPVDLSLLYDEEKDAAILDKLQVLGHHRLRPLRDALLEEGVNVSYTDIKVVLYRHFGLHRK